MACSSGYLPPQTSCRVSLAIGWKLCCTVSLAAAMAQVQVGALCSTAQAISMEMLPWRGANRGGTLYEFTNGGIQVLHAFPAFRGDGSTPIGVVNGSDGLYGITAIRWRHTRAGTLYTTAGGYQVLHSFTGTDPEGSPTSLAADQAGNLYGATSYSYVQCTQAGPLYDVLWHVVLQLSPPDWDPLILENTSPSYTPLTSWVSTDASGNLYGTDDHYGLQGLGSAFNLTCCWNYTDLHDFAGSPNDGGPPEAPPVVDAQGNIYGTTSLGGTYGFGVVWEISP